MLELSRNSNPNGQGSKEIWSQAEGRHAIFLQLTSPEMRTDRIEEAIEMVREMDPDLVIDGPMQADTALVSKIQEDYPFMSFSGPANVLICPNLASANMPTNYCKG